MSLAYQKMLSFNRQFKDTKRIYQAIDGLAELRALKYSQHS